MKKLLCSSAALILCAGAGTAFADDLDADGYDDETGEAVMPSTEEDTGGGETTMTSAPTAKKSSAAGKYKMGISVPLIGGTDFSSLIAALGSGGVGGIPTANILWAVGENWLELGVGIRVQSIAADPAMMIEERTAVGFELDAGYRMMRDPVGRVNPFLKPFVQFGVNDFDEAGDHIILGAGATLGVDVLVFDQFTLGAQIGLGLRSIDTFETMTINTDTSALNATIWW